jgi:hypothetical protein
MDWGVRSFDDKPRFNHGFRLANSGKTYQLTHDSFTINLTGN